MIQSLPRTIMEVFESLPEGTLCQIINSQLIMSPAPPSNHQRVLKKIFLQIDAFVEAHQLGEVFFAPVDVYLDQENVYEPDLIFISNEQMHILQDKIHGAPDLIVEVLSPGSQRFDKLEKKEAYERNGVKEYWIVDPSSKSVTGYQLQNNKYTEILSSNGVITSLLLGLTIHF